MTETDIDGGGDRAKRNLSKQLPNNLYQQHQLQPQTSSPTSIPTPSIAAAIVCMTADPISLCFWICLQPERYVPGSPIFREAGAAPNGGPITPITTAPSAATAAAAAATTGAGPRPSTPKSRGKAMTVSVSHAAQGGSVVTTQSHHPAAPSCYTSTRSAAMMALALGQTGGQSKSANRPASPHTRSASNAPTPSSSTYATALPANRATPSSTPTSSSSKPSTPTAARAAVQLNGACSGGSNSSGSDNDGFNTSSSSTATALRRLYFKSGRSIKNKLNSSSATTTPLNGLPLNPVSSAYHSSVGVAPAPASSQTQVGGVPKLVIMGTSSASIPDGNINTSTDSACTLITNVTHTDTETCDSLDMADTSGPSEPLFSSLEEPLLTAIQIDSEHEHGSGSGGATELELELTSCSRYPPRPDMNLQDSTESQESCLSILTGEPSSTTPLLSSQRRHNANVGQVGAGSGRTDGGRTQESSGRQHSRQPSTAPPPSRTREHFTFDPPQSPKSARSSEKARSHFPFKEAAKDKQPSPSPPPPTPQSQSKYRGYYAEPAERVTSDGDEEENERSASNRNKKLRARDANANNSSRSNSNSNMSRISPSVSPSSSSRTSPKRDRKRTPAASTGAIAKVNANSNSNSNSSMKDGNFFGRQLSPCSASAQQQQRKYSSSSSSGSSATAGGTMFPFDREALDYERIQRECFTNTNPHSSSAATSSDSDEADHCSVYERKLSAQHGHATELFQQYARLSQQEQAQLERHQERHHSERPPSRKNSKRIRPDSVIHTTIRENQQYVPQSDAFYPQPAPKSSSSPSDHSYAELNKFDDIASKFEQIPPKHGSTLNLHMAGSPGSHKSLVSPTSSLRSSSAMGHSPSDLRVDYFTEAQLLANRKRSLKSKRGAGVDLLDECQQRQSNGNGNGTAGGPINVTANPMEAAAVCNQPRATIVVQQPSLSLDNTVETLLIKSEGDFISVEQGKEQQPRKRHSQPHALHQQSSHHLAGHPGHVQQQKRDENMRQLLDVTNTLTIEELRDFEMRYGSPHHSRSQSVKMPGSRASGRPNQLCLPQQRSRVASMPNTGVEEEYYRLRHFSITGKGVVNRGDSLKSRRSRSNNSVASSNSSTEHLTAQQLPAPNSARTSATCSLASSRESSTSNPGNGPYRVLMLGGPAVGKSSLVSQFMTSEYLHAYDTSIDLGNCDIRIHIEKADDDDDSGEKAVSVLLSGEESELIFIDHGYLEMTPDECLTSYDPHGYCVIYSAADRSSFNVAEQVLQVLWTNQNIAQKAVILVANKADLARSRHVTSEEGKAMATAYDCKFIETSVGINHNVDELLVGLLSQIRLKLENPEKSRDLFRKRSIRKSKRRACSPLNAGCLNANTPLGPLQAAASGGDSAGTPPGSAHSSPRKYRGSRTSTSLKVKGLLGRVWTRDSKSKSCENLHVL